MKRRDLLRSIETEVQGWWAKEGNFEVEADPTREKYFLNFPFPYMNGKCHLGHAFSITKCEFAANYQRLQGKNVLWPFAYHCTGMPIQAAATKLKREIEEFGIPPNKSQVISTEKSDKTNQKAKILAKTGGLKYQWDIMKMMGVEESEIPKFQDPNHWLSYFPPLFEKDLKRFGLTCDFRRSFITTDVNIFFDKFVRWQFYKLKENGKIHFGKRPTIYSPVDKQACMDHDRASGEGVGPQEYTLVKMKVLQKLDNFDRIGEDLFAQFPNGIFLVAATLRPETMYGQTNCFVLPDGEYLLIKMKNGEGFVCSERSAQNLCFQDLTPTFGVVETVAKIKGKQLVGLSLSAPRTKYEEIYTLPLLTISMKKGTGVVTSVPSDAPDDYAALKDWQTDEKLRAKFGVKLEWVQDYNVIPIIEIPGLGNQAAVTLCEQKKVKSQKDKAKLAEIKEEVYKKGFYEGVMIVGNDEILGKKVCDVKDIAKKQMIEANEALTYFEPENEVKSRTGGECVVVYLDQWYLNYGEEEWKAKVKGHVNSDNFNAFFGQNLKAFNDTLDWLSDWACSRSFGLGTRVPWDDKFLIESLSDSTIYMAFYTISHLLQGHLPNGKDDFIGGKGSASGIQFQKDDDDSSNALFDYIFLGRGQDNLSSIATKVGLEADKIGVLKKMKAEFDYWYPFNLRTSGKDLIKNHLTMSLYNHAAIWPDQPELWPRGVYNNGHIMVDAEKMSKSAGNFIMLSEAVSGHRETKIGGKDVIIGWGADATRFTCADSGDTLEDANFSCDTANAIILRLTTEIEFMKSIYSEPSSKCSRNQDESTWNFHDKIFFNQYNDCISQTKDAFDSMRYRDAVKFGYFNMQSCRDVYRDACIKMNQEMNDFLIKDFISKQLLILAPICPHFCEYAWRKVLGNETSILRSDRKQWPEAAETDLVLMRTSDFLHDVITKGRKLALETDGSKILTIQIAEKFAPWKLLLLDFVRDNHRDKDAMKKLKIFCIQNAILKPKMKKAMQVGSFVLRRVQEEGPRAFEKELVFDQLKVLEQNNDYVTRSCGVASVVLKLVADDDSNSIAEPGSPNISLN